MARDYPCVPPQARDRRVLATSLLRPRIIQDFHLLKPVASATLGQILGGEPSHVHVHQTRGPRSGQHRGHGQQPQGRMGGPPDNKWQSVLEAPETVWKLRVDEQNVHVLWILRL